MQQWISASFTNKGEAERAVQDLIARGGPSNSIEVGEPSGSVRPVVLRVDTCGDENREAASHEVLDANPGRRYTR